MNNDAPARPADLVWSADLVNRSGHNTGYVNRIVVAVRGAMYRDRTSDGLGRR
jgi:hypothetical protein